GEEAVGLDLLYGVLLPSGAECCLTFAERIAGSEEAFVDMMNEKAKELGMEHTHFTNSTGLQDEDHYSTVRDISVLLRYALAGDTFRQVFTSSSYSTNPSACHPEGFTFVSTMFQEMSSAQVNGGEILGGKTGYTKDAGLCLASLAVIDGKEYILVTAHANGNHETKQYHVQDAVKVYDQTVKAERFYTKRRFSMKVTKGLKFVSGCDMLFSEFKERCSDEKIIYFLKTCGNWKNGTISYRMFVMLSEDRLYSQEPSFSVLSGFIFARI
ncbi:MAG: D-alanyl-D-alanine carboxypeptidase family protein, partial [Blautia marasmi]